MALYLYDPVQKYRGLEKDCDEYKRLRILYLLAYRDAIADDNIWMETHYFQKMSGLPVASFIKKAIAEKNERDYGGISHD